MASQPLAEVCLTETQKEEPIAEDITYSIHRTWRNQAVLRWKPIPRGPAFILLEGAMQTAMEQMLLRVLPRWKACEPQQ